MRGERFLKEMEQWTDERLAQFCHMRYDLFTAGPGNICEPAASNVARHAPFDHVDYPYRDKIGSMEARPWGELRRQPAASLVNPNPFAPSMHRKKGFACWDAAVAIPACNTRIAAIRHLVEIPAVRHSNVLWRQTIEPSLRRAGPLGTAGRLIRPTGPWIFDITRMKNGWKILEAAHVLAHHRGDHKTSYSQWTYDHSRTGGHYQGGLAEIMVSIAYDIPLDVSDKQMGIKGDPDTYYRAEVKSSSRFRLPLIKMPWKGGEAPRFDAMLAVLDTGVFIEPHPYSVISKTGQYSMEDRWCCQPTIVVIAGWESIDFIMHQALGSLHDTSRDPNAPMDYVVHPADLLGPDLFWGYLALGYRRYGVPVPDERWQYFHEWIESDHYKGLLAETPPLPCNECMRINSRALGAPQRPEGPRPKGKMPPVWKKYYDERRTILKTVEKAIESYEALCYGSQQGCLTGRRGRKAGYKAKLVRLRQEARLDRAIEKVRKGERLTDAERGLYYAAKNEGSIE